MMNPIFKKLQFKGHQQIVILHAPASFRPAMKEMEELTEVLEKIKEDKHGFVLGFAEMSGKLDQIILALKDRLTKDDPVLWIAYPKKSSKKYKSDLNRDSGHWTPLGDMGFEGVRQVAIDEDWSALRFRHVDFIKTMKRDSKMAMSEKGKKRTS